MAQVATISRMEKYKPMLFAVLCAVFAAWFAYDGWKNWPAQDNAMLHKMLTDPKVTNSDKAAVRKWPGWNHATHRQQVDAGVLVQRNHLSGWHSTTDIGVQKGIVAALAVLAVASLFWYLRVKKRRIAADEQGLSPREGATIPWPAISVIDNSKWSSTGIVAVRYNDPAGQPQTLKLDDYLYDNLRPILNEIAARATGATMIPPPGAAATTQPPATTA